MKASMGFLPEARQKRIISKEADGELLIYDLERDKAHCLNKSAAAIWKLCDGRTSTKEIAASLTKVIGESVDERLVWLALSDFRRWHLLEDPASLSQLQRENVAPEKSRNSVEWPQAILGMSRREAVKRIGLGAAIAIPVVISITAPRPAQAGSLLSSGSPCSTSAECQAPLNCISNTCQ